MRSYSGFHIPRVMLVGAGDAGRLILRDIQTAAEVQEQVVCIIDDDKNTWRRFMDGVQIVGGREMIPEAVEKYEVDKIYVAIPSASMQTRKEILEICAQTDCEIKNLPGVFQLVSGDVTVSHMRDVSVEDLLGREPVKTDLKEVFELINGKTVLVTGGAGSIGSELCRQIAGHHPKKLIVLDIYENSAYELQLELKERFPDLDCDVLIGIYHGGIERDPGTGKLLSATDENIACRLCEEIPFDLLLTGHQHIALSGSRWHNTHLVQTPCNATGYIRITMDEKKHFTSELCPVPDHADLTREQSDLLERLNQWLDHPIGRLSRPMWPEKKLKMASRKLN